MNANTYNLTKVYTMVPEQWARVFQAAAGRAGVPLPVWIRTALCKAAEIDETQAPEVTAEQGHRLTPARRTILTFLEKATGYQTTVDVINGCHLARQTVYNTVQDLTREGLIERGQNQNVNAGAGAPCKTYTLTPMGRAALESEREAASKAMDSLNARTVASQAPLTGSLAPAPAPTPDQSYRAQVHAALRYIAMSLLGRPIESEKDVQWAKEKHAFLCGVADMDVSKGASTYAAFLEKVTAKINALGGTDAIVERFNVG